MTPKEKADELVLKYYTFGLNNPAQSFSWYECKQCALIAVDEILSINSVDKDFSLSHYWVDVKDEIIKLVKTKTMNDKFLERQTDNALNLVQGVIADLRNLVNELELELEKLCEEMDKMRDELEELEKDYHELKNSITE